MSIYSNNSLACKLETKKQEINDKIYGVPGSSRIFSDPALLWLWRRPVATAPIRPLAWEPPYAEGAALEKEKKTKKKKKRKKEKCQTENAH